MTLILLLNIGFFEVPFMKAINEIDLYKLGGKQNSKFPLSFSHPFI